MPVQLNRSEARRDARLAQIGLIGVVALALATFLILNLGVVSRFWTAAPYEADFAHASGLKSDDPVEISGMRVGSVDEVRINGTHVTVTFHTDEVRLGNRTRAAIKTSSAVGERYLALTPAGSGELKRVPLSRTSVPYDLTAALADVTTDTTELDVDQLADALDAVSGTLSETPDSFRDALSGVHKFATVVADRDEALGRLLADTSSVSDLLADRSTTIATLMEDGDDVLDELHDRRATIHALLVSTRELSAQLTAALRENRAQLRPALDQLNDVATVLNRHEKSLNFLIDHLGGYARNLGEAVGGGPFFYGYVANLVPTNLIPLPIQPQPEF
ncbi:MAG TPA: MCE family protein [Aeromicrobium sp.]|nr:MCE family protein [Aeromicrobium sp.]HKY58897.1 MCE family protein [Aeromicrobium sp.]